MANHRLTRRNELRIVMNLPVILGIISFLSFFTVSIVLFQLTYAQNNSTEFRSGNFTDYGNSTLGVNVKYPSEWQRAVQAGGGISIIQFFSPLQNKSDIFRENVNIAIENLPNNKTNVTQYSRASLSVIAKSLPGFNLTKSNTSENFHGTPAVEKTFTAKQAVLDRNLKAVALDLKMTQIYTLKNNKAYVITFAAESSNYDRFLPTVAKILDSFQIMNQAPNTNGGTSHNATAS
jgi:eukaryotic-like serine/threonine-protein kinase